MKKEDRNKKLEELESRLKALADEIKSLREDKAEFHEPTHGDVYHFEDTFWLVTDENSVVAIHMGEQEYYEVGYLYELDVEELIEIGEYFGKLTSFTSSKV